MTKKLSKKKLKKQSAKIADVIPKKGVQLEAIAQFKAMKPVRPNELDLYTTMPRTKESVRKVFRAAQPPPNVKVPEDHPMAMDDGMTMSWAAEDDFMLSSSYTEGVQWLGYPYLAELAQRPEYRRLSESIAREMTRRWMKLQTVGQQDKTNKIALIEADLKTHKIREKFRRLAELDGFFGRGHLHINVGKNHSRDELKSTLLLDKRKMKMGSLVGFRVIEPTWTYPGSYNSTNPLAEDFYVPQSWYLMAQEVHKSRLLTFISREMPDLLKPAYSFGGLSMSQMAKPYIDNWLRTRQSISDLVHSFSTQVLYTDMSAVLNAGGGEEERKRALLYNVMRDNANLFMIDKTREDFKNVSTPLGTLDHLQAQSQEHICLRAGTLIHTQRGQVPVERVTTSDLVMTRRGYAPIDWSGVTGYTDELVQITTSASVLEVTPCHPIYVETQEFVTAESVQAGDLLSEDPTWQTSMESLRSIEADDGVLPNQAIAAMSKAAVSFIASCGKITRDLYHRVMMFITSMRTRPIIAGSISDSSVIPAICDFTPSTVDWGSIASIPSIQSSASVAARIIRRSGLPKPNIAVTDVNTRHTRVVSVKKISVDGEPVYNLKVADGHASEFYANGVLTHNCSVGGIPLVVFTGIQPSGLNASSEGELQVWEQWIHSCQDQLFTDHLMTVIGIIQINRFGFVDPDITVNWLQLRELTEAEEAEARKTDADVDASYIEMGVLDAAEVRVKVAADPESPYAALDLSKPLPTPPPDNGLPPGDPADGGEGGVSGASSPSDAPPTPLPPQPAFDENLAYDSDGVPVKRYNFDGIYVGIETEKGDKREGKTWMNVMPADYGYIMRSTGYDGDRIDCFIGPYAPVQLPVIIIRQIRVFNGSFDEHKVMMGFRTVTEALAAYDRSFADGKGPDRRAGGWIQMPWKDLKGWLSEESRGARLAQDAFDPAKHPRGHSGNAGQFGNTGGKAPGGSGRGGAPNPSIARGRRAASNTQLSPAKPGVDYPPHIAALNVPPAWHDVRYSMDPQADLLVTGKDAKNKPQAIYSQRFSNTSTEAIFRRTQELDQKYDQISQVNETNRHNAKTREQADCLALIMNMGLRPGSTKDTMADEEAFGATTLQGKHVVTTRQGTSLRFPAKSGVTMGLPVTDPALATMLAGRKKAVGNDGKIFNTSDVALLSYVKQITGGKFQTKDFRTLVGTREAAQHLSMFAVPTTPDEYKKSTMAIAKLVSQKLGNTPQVAIKTYINPAIFAEWRLSANV